MSYVLTEIALEMLGYKFYNVNGDHMKLSFQDMQEDSSDGGNGIEPNLSDVLQLKDNLNIAKTKDVATTAASSPVPTTEDNLSILFENEYAKLTKELGHAYVAYVRSHASEIEAMDHESQSRLNLFIAGVVHHESQLLDRELKTIDNFRQNVENHLVRLNPKSFREYARALKKNLQDDALKTAKATGDALVPNKKSN